MSSQAQIRRPGIWSRSRTSDRGPAVEAGWSNVIRAELIHLSRRRVVVLAALGAVVFAVVAAATVFAAAKAGGPGFRGGREVTLATLGGAGGGTQAFATAASFVGFFVFVTFIALRGSELSGGTFRAWLLRDPDRRRVLIGQFLGLLLVSAAVVAVAEVLTFAASIPMAAARGVPTSAWFSLAGLEHALGDYATVLAGVAGWAVFGTTLAIIFGSVPIALGVGFVWAGPFEHLFSNVWTAGTRWFPGLVLESVIAGGNTDLGLGRAVLTAIFYGGVAAAVALTLTTKRDVTA
jgi:ABC-2 type transport system permease protein